MTHGNGLFVWSSHAAFRVEGGVLIHPFEETGSSTT